MVIKCPICDRDDFKSEGGLSNHISWKHPSSTDGRGSRSSTGTRERKEHGVRTTKHATRPLDLLIRTYTADQGCNKCLTKTKRLITCNRFCMEKKTWKKQKTKTKTKKNPNKQPHNPKKPTIK